MAILKSTDGQFYNIPDEELQTHLVPTHEVEKNLKGAPEAVAVAEGSGDGTPVRWNPCRPINWVLNDDQGPDEAESLAIDAFERVATVTGLDFRYLGTTEETPVTNRATVLDDYGTTSWAPVLVAWTRPSAATPLVDTDQALAIPVAVEGVFVTGQILLNSDLWLSPDFAARSVSWGGALLHEVGHLVGLDHVDDPTQLMHAQAGSGSVRFGSGDLAGFRAVGAGAGDGGCLDAGTPRLVEVEVRGRR